MNQIIARCGILFVVVSNLDQMAQAAGKPKSVAPDPVQELLQVELKTTDQTLDRRDALKPGTRADNDSAAAWWQAGYLQSGKQWLKFEDSTATGASFALLDDYQMQRNKLTGQPHGELQLANWCRKNGLLDQERVHLLRVLYERDATVNIDTVYERLGCKKVDDVWVSPQERRDNARQNAEIEQSHQQWDAKFTLLAKNLEGTPKQRELALKQLSEVTDPSAVPALISSFCMRSQTLAEDGVKALGQIPEYQASRALAGQAVFSPWKSVRMRSTESLKSRKFEEYVPDLLLLLSSPVRAGIVASTENVTGRMALLHWDYVWIEESQDTLRVAVGRLVPVSSGLTAGTVQFSRKFGTSRLSNDSSTRTAVQELTNVRDELEYAAERTSEARSELNERVGKVLSECTEEPMKSDAKFWWNWWTTYSAVAPGPKKTYIVPAEKQYVKMPPMRVVAMSCFVAGTAVWTERGPVSIEQILPGDRVLSKDVNSGELTYKPVVQTTKREPTSVHKIQVADDDLVASLGHHFWVNGEGWTNTKHLESDQPLHTATGMRRIASVLDEGHHEQVYNLVVADFHTYFVGKSMVLSHDVTTPQLTNVKVPGLVAK